MNTPSISQTIVRGMSNFNDKTLLGEKKIPQLRRRLCNGLHIYDELVVVC